MSRVERRKSISDNLVSEIMACLQTYGVVTAGHISKRMDVTRQLVSRRLAKLAKEGKVHVAYRAKAELGIPSIQVWAAGLGSEATEPELELKLAALRSSVKPLIPDTPYKTVFVNGVSPWRAHTT